MVTGRVPFEGDTAFSIGIKHKSEKPKDPKEFNPQLPEELSRVILKCLEKESTQRYQNAGDIRSDLETIEAGIPSTEKITPQRRPLTSREITVTLGVKKLFIPALVLTAIVLTGLFLWHPWAREKTSSLSSEGKPSLAVMYFENNTGDEALSHWRKGIADLLITDLMQSKYLKVLGGDQLVKILTQLDQLETQSYSSEVLKRVAAQAGVDHIARGSYSRAGNILRIDMVLQEAESGDPIATKKVEGETEAAIFTMVDELTKWTKESLMLSAQQMADDLDEEIGTVTTSSPEAYKFYMDGLNFFEKGEYEKSIEPLGKAIAQDPGFAMAYRKIAHAYGNTNKPKESKKYLQKALDLAERLTEKEKLLIQGDYFGFSEPDYDKAIEAYGKLIELYPESDEAISACNNLGILYSDIEEWDKAIECYEKALNSVRTYRGTYTNLAYCCMASGHYDKAESILKKSIELYPDFINGHWTLARLYAFQGQMDLALDEVDKTAALDPTYTKARFYLLQWDFEKAEEEYFKWFGHIQENYHLSARVQLDHLYRTQGRFKEAENQLQLGIEQAEKMNHEGYLENFFFYLAYLKLRQKEFEAALEAVTEAEKFNTIPINSIYSLELKGWIYAEKGELDKALKTAKELKEMIDKGPYKKQIRNYDFLMGIIQLKNKNYSDAIHFFNSAVSLLPYPAFWETDDGYYRYHLALAYYESGDLQRAREKFEELIHLIPGRNSWGDCYAQSYYLLGMIYEKQGEASKAAQNYEKFLDLWKDADPFFSSDVEDASKRLAELDI
ncbi:MAG: tetratricopeptide repeat protein [Candidatus Aminicenantes bacterium]